MKTVKYLLVAVAALGLGTTAKAQDGSQNDVEAVKKLISQNPADMDKQLKPFYKANKKNADNLVAFGRAFYDAGDTARARVYANYAIDASKRKSSPAFVLLGDIAVKADEGGEAALQYEQAIMADPKEPQAYYKYALIYRKRNRAGAMAKLDELKQYRPDIDIESIKGHIAAISGDEEEAFKFYSQVPVARLDRNSLIEYGRACFFTGHFKEGLDAANQGLTIAPRNANFNRYAMMFNYELKDYEKAKYYIDRYFNHTDSAKVSDADFFYAGLILEADKDYAGAIDNYKKALAVEDASSIIGDEKILEQILNAHIANGDYPSAISHYREHFITNNAKATYKNHVRLGELYQELAKGTEDAAAKAEALKSADDTYREMGEKYTDLLEYATYMRASINSQLDPDLSQGLAKPYYEKLIELIAPKAEKTKGDIQFLTTAYHYMMYSRFLAKDIPGAKEFAGKILEINPEYAPAQQIMELK